MIVLKVEKVYALSKLQWSPIPRDQRSIIMIIIEKVSFAWMRFFCSNSDVCEYSLSLSLSLSFFLSYFVDLCTWHASVILVERARHVASVRILRHGHHDSHLSVCSSGSTAEHKCPQEERYRGIWLGPPGRRNRPSCRAVSNPLRFF